MFPGCRTEIEDDPLYGLSPASRKNVTIESVTSLVQIYIDRQGKTTAKNCEEGTVCLMRTVSPLKLDPPHCRSLVFTPNWVVIKDELRQRSGADSVGGKWQKQSHNPKLEPKSSTI
ncbi:hypothetical protein J6590_036649 [Homalodisca vitripennis]|nr:hypothetical protein J6590_036649 [Homalodisca vitripennis]